MAAGPQAVEHRGDHGAADDDVEIHVPGAERCVVHQPVHAVVDSRGRSRKHCEEAPRERHDERQPERGQQDYGEADEGPARPRVGEHVAAALGELLGGELVFE